MGGFTLFFVFPGGCILPPALVLEDRLGKMDHQVHPPRWWLVVISHPGGSGLKNLGGEKQFQH